MLASIPPTKAAMEQHTKRVYLELQNNSTPETRLSPTDFGWRSTSNGLLPIPTALPTAPPEVLRTIFCSCTKGCGGACGCRKSGLLCNTACKNCEGTGCSNKKLDDSEDDGNGDDNACGGDNNDNGGDTNNDSDYDDEVDSDYRVETDDFDDSDDDIESDSYSDDSDNFCDDADVDNL